jgi:autotransporter adhesin
MNLKSIDMKKLLMIIAVSGLFAVNSDLNAQTTKSKEVRKEVNVEEENGVKILTVKTTTDGNTQTEVYKGAEAEAKLAEFAGAKTGTTKTMVIGEDGKKHLKVEKKVVIREEKEDKK